MLINNAGITGVGHIERTTVEQWDRLIDGNIAGVVRGRTTFAPMVKAQQLATS